MKRILGVAVVCAFLALSASSNVATAQVVAQPAVVIPAAPVTTVAYRRYWGAPYYAYRPYYRAYPYRAYYRPYRAYYAPNGYYGGPGYYPYW